jgi:hypothetical protein
VKNLNKNIINDNDMKNDTESKDDNKDNKDKRNHFFRNNKSKRKTTLFNPHKAIKLQYQDE